MDTQKTDAAATPDAPGSPTPQQAKWLRRGLVQPGGKLPLFDEEGQRVSSRTVKSCLKNGWAEPWFDNPLKPNWQICKLTEVGRALVDHDQAAEASNVYPLHS